MSKGPARGYSWPAFEEGNEAALSHGARSPRHVQPLADQFRTELTQIAPWTQSPAFAGAVASWAWAEAQAALLRSWLAEHLDLEDERVPWPAEMLRRVESQLLKLRSELGLSPQSLGALLSKAASVASATADQASLEALKAEGRAILQARGELEAGTDG